MAPEIKKKITKNVVIVFISISIAASIVTELFLLCVFDTINVTMIFHP